MKMIMKKLFSGILTVCIAFSLFAASPVSAELQGQAGDEVEWTLIRTVEEFCAIQEGNYRLANDLDFSEKGLLTSVIVPGVAGKTVRIDGNGKSLNNLLVSNAPLFDCSNAALNLTLEKLTVNLADGSRLDNGNGIIGKIAFGNILLREVTVKGHITSEGQKSAFFFGQAKSSGTIAFDSCVAEGSIDYTKSGNSHFAGFIALIDGGAGVDATKYTFTNCTNRVTISENENNVGGFIGQMGGMCTVAFRNCTNHADLTGKDAVGGFVAKNTVAAKYLFENCVNNGVVTCKGNGSGGFIGWDSTGTSTVTFQNCVNGSNIRNDSSVNWTSAGFMGIIAGARDNAVTVLFHNCLNTGSVELKSFQGGSAFYVGANANSDFQGVQLENCYYLNCGQVSAYVTNNTMNNAVQSTDQVHPVSATELESGKTAYLLGAAFGQELGAEPAPVLNGKKVTAIQKTDDDVIYTNELSLAENRSVGLYYQVRNDMRAIRILMVVDAAVYEEAASVNIVCTLTADGVKKSFTLSKADLGAYDVVSAAGVQFAAAADCKIMGFVINNLPAEPSEPQICVSALNEAGAHIEALEKNR